MLLGIYYLNKNKFLRLNHPIDFIVVSYLSYNLFSIVPFLLSGLPIGVFIKEFSNSILPLIFFYFFGKSPVSDLFYNRTLKALIAIFLVGFLLQYTVPLSYAIHMNKIDAVGGTSQIYFLSNYRSYLGLTATGSLSAVSVLLALDKIFESNFKNGKFAFLVSAIALLLTFRRAALFTGLFAFLWLNAAYFFLRIRTKWQMLFLVGIFVVSGACTFKLFNKELFENVILRFMSFSEAINERSGDWWAGLNNTTNILTGDGLGRYSHKAVEYSDVFISDGNYFRILAEVGIIGFALFILIIISALIKSIINFKKYYLEMGLIIMICLQAIGSNVFAFQLIAPIFWFTLGRLNRIKRV